jgi:serine/threonine protein kinase
MTTEARAFGRYELRGVLGQGGFATVYRAYDPLLGREVALKALLPHLAADLDVRARFEAEARALAALRHPNVVTVYDVGEADGLPFFAMELVAGETLAARLAGGTPPQHETLHWLADIASALDYLHAAGLVHRDVKPANVLVETSGRAVLMDLGIARSMDNTSHTLAGTSLGTPAYMAPELVRGEVAGPSADIYALGILAYQLLAGHPPFQGDTAYVLHAQVYDPPPLDDLPYPFASALAVALAKDPSQRPASATAFIAALNGAEQAAPITTPSNTMQQYAPMPPPPQAWLHESHADAPGPWYTPLPARRSGVTARALAVASGVLVLLVLFVVALSVVLTRGRANNSAVGAITAILPATSPVMSVVPTATTSGTVVSSNSVAATADSSVTATHPIASATDPTSPSISPAAVTALTVDTSAVQAWAAGQGPISVTASFAGVPSGVTVVARISPTDDLGNPVGQCDPVALGASDGDKLVSIARISSGVLPSGNYLLIIYLYGTDGAWVQQTRTREIAVTPPPVYTQAPLPAPTQQPAPPPTLANNPNPPGLGYPATDVDGSRLWIGDVQSLGPVRGGMFSFAVTVYNDGTATGLGSISVSSVDAAQITNIPTNCTASGQDPQSFQPGAAASIYKGSHSAPSKGTFSYPLGELEFSSLPANSVCSVRFTVTAQPSASTIRLFLRVSTLDSGGVVATWPANSSQTDQQNYPVVVWTVPAR